MILRIWHGWTDRSDAPAYQQLLDTRILPAIVARNIPGLNSIDVLRRDTDEDEVEFITIMAFDDWNSVTEFAGAHPTGSVVPDAARRLLRRYDTESDHYHLVASQPSSAVSAAGITPTRWCPAASR